MTPNQGGTYGSQALQVGGKQTRAAAAAAYQTLLGMASTRLGVAVGSLTVSKGVVSGGGKSVSYGDLIGGKLFNVTIRRATSRAVPGGLRRDSHPVLREPSRSARTRSSARPRDRRGSTSRRRCIGTYTYVHNIRIPGMLHARVVRPRGQGAFGDGTAPKVLSVDPALDQPHPERQDHSEEQLRRRRGAEGVRRDPGRGPAEGHVGADAAASGRREPLEARCAARTRPGRRPWCPTAASATSTPQSPGRRIPSSQTYMFHYNGHMPIGPSCSVADVTLGWGTDLHELAGPATAPAGGRVRARAGRAEPACERDPGHLQRGRRASTASRRMTTAPAPQP